MNRQQKKAWLKEAWNLTATIEYCQMVLNSPSVYSSPGFGERVQAGKSNSEEAKVAKLMAEADRRAKDMDNAILQLEKRKKAINALKDGNQKKVLWLRYIEHYSWEDVCLSMSYSRTRVNEIHDAGVNRITIL
ncbi:MAG: DUF1492 domain-containing protein [Oscillospiraceae bacterium]|nr:DUF1492 domain-containing protein [Oscillospiraceae bacterium]